MSEAKFAKSNDGLVHLISAINGEFTLCGNAFDGDAGLEHDPTNAYAWKQSNKGPVTCERCATEIRNCRRVRIKANGD